jgi:hypothetical protein
MIRVAKRNIIAYKQFLPDGTSPVQDHPWGKLKRGRRLVARAFDKESFICTDGVHSFSLKGYAISDESITSNAHKVVWRVIIPKGTKYYQSTNEEARNSYDCNAKGLILRSKLVVLQKQVFGN